MKDSAQIPDQIGVDSCPAPQAHFFRGAHVDRTFKSFLKAFYSAGSVNSLPSLHSRCKRFDTASLERRLLTRFGVYFKGVLYSSPDLMKLSQDRHKKVSLLVGHDPLCPRALIVIVEKSKRTFRAFAVKP